METATTETIASATPQDAASQEQFQSGQVLTISSGHFFHDIYTSFVPALLPVIIDKLSLSLAMAGSLTAIQSLPGVLNPFIGYLADKVSLRYFVILAPAITATLIGGLSFAPNYLSLVLIFFMTGISIAVFHALGTIVAGIRSREQLSRRRWLRGDLAMVVAGVLLLGAIRLIPVAGQVVWGIASVFGIGAALATKFGRREPWFLVWRPVSAE